jgi:hypothetical protein
MAIIEALQWLCLSTRGLVRLEWTPEAELRAWTGSSGRKELTEFRHQQLPTPRFNSSQQINIHHSMPLGPTAGAAHPCSRCRRRKIHCGRQLPSCRTCEQASDNCSYPSSNARYTVNRVRSCTECRRQRARCDRKRPCTSCISSQVECRYTDTESMRADGEEEPETGEPSALSSHETTGPDSSAATFKASDSLYPSVLLASDPFPINITPMHPSIPQIWLLWHAYLENVDPLYKLFHAPSCQVELLRVVQNLQAINADVETLLFAVYFAAIGSLTYEDCMHKFKEEKLVLLKR